MVCAGISHDGHTQLKIVKGTLNVVKYRDDVLDPIVGLWSSITCVTTSCSIDSFAFPTHRTNQSLDKGLWDVVPLVHKVRRAAPVMFQMD
jgi:hypothetical protein